MKYVAVRNFEKFQHYRDRSPPWIKLYTAILEDYDFMALPEAARLHVLMLWVLASRLDNKIPNDERFIRTATHATSRVNIPLLLDQGFLVEWTPDRTAGKRAQRAANASTHASTGASSGGSAPLAKVERGARRGARHASTRASTGDVNLEHGASLTRARALAERQRERERQSTETDQVPTSVAVAPATNGQSSWLAPLCAVWEGFCGEGSFAAVAGQAAKCFRPLVKAHGVDAVGDHLTVYLAQSDPTYRAINRFAANYAAYKPHGPLYEADRRTPTPYLSKLLDPEQP